MSLSTVLLVEFTTLPCRLVSSMLNCTSAILSSSCFMSFFNDVLRFSKSFICLATILLGSSAPLVSSILLSLLLSSAFTRSARHALVISSNCCNRDVSLARAEVDSSVSFLNDNCSLCNLCISGSTVWQFSALMSSTCDLKTT